MGNRREFLKTAATGAVLLSTELATALSKPAPSRVVVARDNALHGELDEQKVLALLDKAMAAYTGRHKPVEAWKHAIPTEILAGKTIGLKVNGLGGRGISTHAVLVEAICERLQQVGVKPGNIVVWDRNARDLEACGLTINASDRSRMRCFGSDVAGFEDEPVACGPAQVRFSKLLTRECAMVIGLPILKEHGMSGVTFAMKNMYGVIDHPNFLHAGKCNPGVADLNALPVVRNKVRLTIGDALTSVYEGGPGFHPQFLWYPNALVVGEDRVAVDHTAWQMLEAQRKHAGLPDLTTAGREPKYIATAADAAHRLGTCEPERIHTIEV